MRARSTPNRAADINPADIETVEILKGSAAAAIYGAAASNGAVLITTKSGKPGATRYSFNSTRRWTTSKGIPLQRMYGQGSYGVDAHCRSGGVNNDDLPDCTPVAPNQAGTTYGSASRSWGALLDPGTPVFNHATEIYDTGMTFDNNLTLSGGSDQHQLLPFGRFDEPERNHRRPQQQLRSHHGPPQGEPSAPQRPQPRRQSVVCRFARELRPEGIESGWAAPRRAPHAAKLQQPSISRAPRAGCSSRIASATPRRRASRSRADTTIRSSPRTATATRASSVTFQGNLTGRLVPARLAEGERNPRRRLLQRLAPRGAAVDVVR